MQKNKAVIALCIAICLMALTFVPTLTSCGHDDDRITLSTLSEVVEYYRRPSFDPTKRPDGTQLEFWITEDVKDVDWSSYDNVPGWKGAKEYYGKGYKYAIDRDGHRSGSYVSYIVSAYPDYTDGGQYVTSIEITDPAVTLYGLSVESSIEEFEKFFKERGFDTQRSGENDCVCMATNGKFAFSFLPGLIRIRAEIENRDGIVF